MTWGDRADDRYSVESVGKSVSIGRWLTATIETLTGTTPDMRDQYELQIKETKTWEIVFRETIEGGIAADEALRLANERLETMTFADFSERYSIETPSED